jgi:trimethylamine--corrinoid protein Co-methyltransferase
MDHGNLVSPEFMVLVNDIVTSVKHFMDGIPVNRETLALDIIDKVGPGGHYLQEQHTMDHFRKIKYSDLFERQVYANWEKAGSRTLEQRLQKLTLEKMEHRPAPLSPEVVAELDRMQAAWK